MGNDFWFRVTVVVLGILPIVLMILLLFYK
jgi:hypothetical protein